MCGSGIRAEDSNELLTGQNDFLLAFRGDICQWFPWGADLVFVSRSAEVPGKLSTVKWGGSRSRSTDPSLPTKVLEVFFSDLLKA